LEIQLIGLESKGHTPKKTFFLDGDISPKIEIKIKKLKKSVFGGFHLPEMRGKF
jgi:hypothetical protein